MERVRSGRRGEKREEQEKCISREKGVGRRRKGVGGKETETPSLPFRHTNFFFNVLLPLI